MTVRFPKVRSCRALRCAAFALACLLTAGLVALGGALPRAGGPGLAPVSTVPAISARTVRGPAATAVTAAVVPEPDDPSDHARITLVGAAAAKPPRAARDPRAGADPPPDRIAGALPERPPRA